MATNTSLVYANKTGLAITAKGYKSLIERSMLAKKCLEFAGECSMDFATKSHLFIWI